MRIGGFEGPSGPYGVAPNAIHPRDNDITPDPAQAEADSAQARADELFAELKNALRDPNAGKATPTKP